MTDRIVRTGTPSLCAPGRLYLQITAEVSRSLNQNIVETARLMALMSIILADVGTAAWESKYHWLRERPVTAVRDSASRDGNPLTAPDASWVPLGAPASNTAQAPDFTPPFPAQPSGHASFGGAFAETLRYFVGTDQFPVTFVSDEYSGQSRDRVGKLRPRVPRTFASFTEMEVENAQSRMYLGIHWQKDATTGIKLGNEVARYILALPIYKLYEK